MASEIGAGTDPSSPVVSPVLSEGSDVCILGAGFAGLSTAFFLSRSGLRVTVLDQGRGPAEGGSSFGSGCLLIGSSAGPLPGPRVWTHLRATLNPLAWITRRQPLNPISSHFSWPVARFGFQFLKAARKTRWEAGAVAMQSLAVRTNHLAFDLAPQIGLDTSRSAGRGLLRFYTHDWTRFDDLNFIRELAVFHPLSQRFTDPDHLIPEDVPTGGSQSHRDQPDTGTEEQGNPPHTEQQKTSTRKREEWKRQQKQGREYGARRAARNMDELRLNLLKSAEYLCLNVPKKSVTTLAPFLASLKEQTVGGIFHPEDAWMDAREMSQRIADICSRKYDVEFLWETQILGPEVQGDRLIAVHTDRGKVFAENFVVALGYASRSFTESLPGKAAFSFPMLPVKGYGVTIPYQILTPPNLGRTLTVQDFAVAAVEGETHTFFTPLKDGLRVTFGAEVMAYPKPDIPEKTKLEGIRSIRSIFPWTSIGALRDNCDWWTGFRPVTADTLPVIGPLPGLRNVFLNTGHGTLGWTLGMASGELCADLLLQKDTPKIDNWRLFLPDRFL